MIHHNIESLFHNIHFSSHIFMDFIASPQASYNLFLPACISYFLPLFTSISSCGAYCESRCRGYMTFLLDGYLLVTTAGSWLYARGITWIDYLAVRRSSWGTFDFSLDGVLLYWQIISSTFNFRYSLYSLCYYLFNLTDVYYHTSSNFTGVDTRYQWSSYQMLYFLTSSCTPFLT